MEGRREPRGHRPGRGTLAIIAVLLLGSALLRVGLQATEAIAREASPEELASAAGSMSGPHASAAVGHTTITENIPLAPESRRAGNQLIGGTS